MGSSRTKLIPYAAASCLMFHAHVFAAQSISANLPSTHVSAPKQAPVEVKLRLLQAVSSSNARRGQAIALEVAEPVADHGTEEVPAGAHADAIVTSVRRRGHNRREGRVVITVQTLTLHDGRRVPLQSAVLQQGSGRGATIFGPCTFPFPADPAGLFRKGKDVVIPAGTIVTASLAY